MTISQDIFNGLSADWKWASMASNGVARVHTDKPNISRDNVVLYNLGSKHTALRGEFDATGIPPEGLTPVIVERTEPFNAPPYETDGKGVPLQPAAPCNVLTVAQVEDDELWKFAKAHELYVSVNPYGVVWFNEFKEGAKPRRAYDVEVTGVTRTIEQTRSSPQLAPPQAGAPMPTEHLHVLKIQKLVGDLGEEQAWEPGYAEFNKGVAIGLELAIATIQGRAPNYNHTPVANPYPISHSNSVIQFGDETFVWYDEAGMQGGVAYTLDTANQALANYADCLNGKQEAVADDHGWAESHSTSLDQAKEHAQYLLRDDALTVVQYMAIFGELPE